MPWKVVVLFPDDFKPMLGRVLPLDRAMHTSLEYIDKSGDLQPPPWIQYNRTDDRRTPSVEDRVARARNHIGVAQDRPSIPNPDVPPPPPSDLNLAEADDAGYAAYSKGRTRESNPYHPVGDRARYEAWAGGWDRAEYGDPGDGDDSQL